MLVLYLANSALDSPVVGWAQYDGTGETFHVIECKNPPKQGRSGGGLFTNDYYVAGVCDFADPQHGNGLYAEPASIYRLLMRRNGAEA